MKITFLLQKGKTNKTGLTPLRCRVTIDKQRKQFSTGIFIHSDHWSQEKQKVLEEAENAKTVNSQISLIKQKLGQAFLMVQIQEEPFDVEDIYKIFSGENVKKEMGVMAVYEEHNTYYKKLIGKDIKEVSCKSSRTRKVTSKNLSSGSLRKRR